MTPSVFSIASGLQEKPRAAARSLDRIRRIVGLAMFCLASWAVAILCPLAQAQTNEWTWIGGGSTITCGTAGCGQAGVYGTVGKAAPGNLPGGREGAATWTDNNGNLWLFGGVGEDANGIGGFLNDLWEFNPSTNEWAWMGGSSTLPASCAGSTTVPCGQPGVYGTLGTPSAGNIPGARSLEVTWTDSSGNFWLFGGSGFDSGNGSYDANRAVVLNDLWKYTPSTGLWTWMGGSSSLACPSGAQYSCNQLGVFGTQGVAASGNIPESTATAAASTDSQGNFWLLGGNDLWELNPSTNLWTWISGAPESEQTFGTYGAYGTEGTPAAGNFPGTRSNATGWFDGSNHFWLYGGNGLDAISNAGYLDDLWEFDLSTKEWVWLGGSDSSTCWLSEPCPTTTVFGTKGVPAAANTPGNRSGASSWTDKSGNFWLFGSDIDNPDSTPHPDKFLNDLWAFNPPSQEWVWMSGSPVVNESGTYGTMGTPAATNTPGGRNYASRWIDGSGNLWLFGGNGLDSAGLTGYLNDLWEYKTPAITWPAPAPTFSVPAGSYTSAQTVTISATLAGATIYYTTNGTMPTTNSSVYSTPIVVSSSETIDAIATASGYSASALASAAYIIGPAGNPIPVLYSISPAVASAGGAAFTLTVNGSGFVTNSTVYGGSTALTTTYVSASQLTAAVTSANIASAGIYNVTVQSPTPGGGTSNAFQFEVDSAGSGTTTFTTVTATVASGSSASYPVTLPSGASNATVSCLNLPAGAACSFSSTTNSVTITTSSTTPAGTYQITVVFTVTEPGAAAGFVLLPILLLPLVLVRRKLAARGAWVTACMGLILLAAAAAAVVACGGGSGGSGGGGSGSAPQTHQATSSGVVTLIVQ
jgi:N-acetylneuraminic acid mutarotase